MSTPLRLMLVTDAVGGVWDSCLALARALLASEAARVLLVSVGPPPSVARLAEARAVDGLELEVLDGRLEWMADGQHWLEQFRMGAGTLAARWRADVVHVNQLGLAGLSEAPGLRGRPDRPAVVLGVHSDIVTWWTWVKDGGDGLRTLPEYLRWQYDLAWSALRRADAVVCPSAFLAGEVQARYQLTDRPHVIHNGATLRPPAGPAPRREADLAAVVGRAWDEAKNVGVVAGALRACQRPWRVEVAGDLAEPGKPPAPPLRAPGMTYLGFLSKDRLAALFQRAALCIAPSSYEPFGLAPVEAALMGCAVVANDLPSFREVWGDAAAYFARNDPDSLAQVLDRLSRDPAEVARLAAAAYAHAAGRYTTGKMAGAYLTLYREVLTRRAITTLTGEGDLAVYDTDTENGPASRRRAQAALEGTM